VGNIVPLVLPDVCSAGAGRWGMLGPVVLAVLALVSAAAWLLQTAARLAWK